MIRNLSILLLLLVTSQGLVAQEDALYSNYMFNPFAINPAYAGTRESVSAVLLHRSQWLGVDGAPVGQSFALHSPVRNKNFALGFNAINDAVGPTKKLGFFGNYAYHIKLRKGHKLSLGVRGGVFNSQLDMDQLTFKDPSDKFNSSGIASVIIPSFDAGFYYFSRKFFAGLSVTHLSQSSFNYFELSDGSSSNMSRHYFASVGAVLKIHPEVFYKPSTYIKYTDQSPLNIDLNNSFLFYKRFLVGVSYRTTKVIILNTELNLTDYLRIGYSYDLALDNLHGKSGGTHEIFIGFDFNLSKIQSISPRSL